MGEQRRYYRRRLKEEPGFRESERVRCREAMRVRRSRPEPSSADPHRLCPHELLAGLVSQLGGTSDPAEVNEMMGVYAARGRRLAVRSPIRGSPAP